MSSLRQNLMIFLGFLATAVISAALLGSSSDLERLPIPSSYSAAPEGCKALYMLLEEFKLPVSRFRKSFQNLGSQQSVLIVVDAGRIPFTERELAKLEDWIKSGNKFVFFQGGFSKAAKKESARSGGDSSSTRTGPARRLALKFGLRLKTFPGGSRGNVDVSSRHLEGITELSVSNLNRWTSAPQGWSALAGDEAGPVVLAKEMGKGEMIAVSDSTMIQNRFIGQAQNVRLVPALLLGDGRPEHIFFDEYHHGHQVSESLWSYVGSSVFAWIMLQSVLFVGLFFYSRRAGQTGRYRPLDRSVGRSSLEHVDSMANVFASCKAGSVALEAMLQRFLSRLSKRTGVPVNAIEKGGIHNRLPGDSEADEISDLVRDCRNALQTNEDTERVVQLAGRLAKAQLKLGDGLPGEGIRKGWAFKR
ncbi:MAG: DUF4350 domain-containing protein [Desulfomonile tiedjei]|nr:DUF4350 domain-containing protein [Desulfomonile tiedjei]